MRLSGKMHIWHLGIAIRKCIRLFNQQTLFIAGLEIGFIPSKIQRKFKKFSVYVYGWVK